MWDAWRVRFTIEKTQISHATGANKKEYNVVLDFFLAVTIVVASATALSRLSKRHKLDFPPLALVGMVALTLGFFLYLPDSPLFIPSDGQFYLAWGQAIADSWSSGDPLDARFAPQPIWPGKGLWPALIASLTYLMGPVTAVFIAFNSVVLCGALLALQKATVLLSGKARGWELSAIALTSPPLLIFGPSLLRESIFWLGVSLWSLSVGYAFTRKLLTSVALGIAGSLILLLIRPDAGLVLSYAFATVAILVGAFHNWRGCSWRRVLAAAAVVGLLFTFPSSLEQLRPNTSPESLANQADSLAHPDVTSSFYKVSEKGACSAPLSAWVQKLPPHYISTALCQASQNLPKVIFGPFLQEYSSEAIWLVAGVSGIHFLFLAALALKASFSRYGRNLLSAGIWIVASASIILFATILTNYGILIRFRVATEMILMPLAGSGLGEIFDKLKSKRRLSSPTATLDG